MNNPPIGTVTFLFTDIEGSTKLWQHHPDTMTAALNRHHALLNESITAHGGYVFQIIGDAFCAAFFTANDGLGAALDAQHALAAENWDEIGAVRVRMALHTGRAEVQPGDFTSGEYISGLTLSRAARLLSAGHGGQILLSLATAELVRDHLPNDVSLRDLGARRLKDLIRPEQIFQVLAPGLPADFPPLKTLDVHPHNLPVQLTSFIGREREMAEIKNLLTGTHLLTLTGVGGTGKTRLSLQVAADLIDEYPGGVWLVELAPLRDPGLVEQTVASVLGVREQPGRPLSELLVEELRDRQALFLLDNCEHVIAACARLADLLLRSAPNLKILATSRIHLNIAGETTYPVLPLALPDPARPPIPQALAQYEAVRLFIDRATAVQPSFCVTNENAPAVAQICTHLDGIPLAIELAAARARLLSPDQISARLGDRFHLLTGGSRSALPRQQTLQAAIDWSYDLLSTPEQALFNRLAVFAGSFSLEAVEAVCSDPEAVPAARVLDLMAALVDHSLVVVQDQAVETRYVLLETIRQYALEKLQAAGNLLALQNRYLGYYLELAERSAPYTKIGTPGWLDKVNLEYDNFRGAMTYAIVSDLGSAIRLGTALLSFWEYGYYFREAYEWALKLLRLTDTWPPCISRAMVLRLAGSLAATLDYQSGEAFLKSSIAMARELGDKSQVCEGLLCLIGSQSPLYSQKSQNKREYLEEFLTLSQDLALPDNTALAFFFLGSEAVDRGDIETGASQFEISRELSYIHDFPEILSFNLFALANLARLEGNLPKSETLYKECELIRRKVGNMVGLAGVLGCLGEIALERCDISKASALFNESLQICQEMNNTPMMIFVIAGFSGIAGVIKQYELAARLFGATEAAFEKYQSKFDTVLSNTYDPIIAEVREQLGEERFQAEWEAGRKLTLEEALELARR